MTEIERWLLEQGGRHSGTPEAEKFMQAAYEIDRMTWLIENGERCFGTLWRDATNADIERVRDFEHRLGRQAE